MIAVVCEPPPESAGDGAMSAASKSLFAEAAGAAGFKGKDFVFVRLCEPVPKRLANAAKLRWERIEQQSSGVVDRVLQVKPEVVIAFGNDAARVVLGRQIKITKERGAVLEAHGLRVVPMYGPGMVLAAPQYRPALDTDLAALYRLREAGWDANAVEPLGNTRYRYVDDLQFLLDMTPGVMSVDTEGWNRDKEGGSALKPRHPDTRVLTVQLSWAKGESVAVPVDLFGRVFPDAPAGQKARLISQLARLLGDPRWRKVTQNGIYDSHILHYCLGITLRGWTHDLLMLSHAIDEEMPRRSLDDVVRRWVPEMANYADSFGRLVDERYGGKGNMELVPHGDLLPYAAGDADATRRGCSELVRILRRDKAAYEAYRRISMPGLIAYATMERTGLLVDKDQLRKVGEEMRARLEADYLWLIEHAPAAVRKRHMLEAIERKRDTYKTDKGRDGAEAKVRARERKVLAFTRIDFVHDILFAVDGFALPPVVYTKSTADLAPDEEDGEVEDQRVASTSAKQHLPFFFDHPVAGEYVARLARYQKLVKMARDFVGEEVCSNEDSNSFGEPTGIWQYINHEGRVHPRFLLWVTKTARTNSRDPNGQNFPSRGPDAKLFAKIFVAPPGWRVIAADLSQIELRIVAWLANDPVMLRIYREGGDIHTFTAMAVMGISKQAWDSLSKDKKKEYRTNAKAVNFGFVYGMSWRKFKLFAFTEYGVRLTDEQAQQWRDRYFKTYPALEAWHESVRAQAARDGFIRCIDGGVRHLPLLLHRGGVDRLEGDERDVMRRKIGDAERQAINSGVQRLGSQFTVAALARLVAQNQYDWLRPCNSVHDALYCYVRQGREREGVDALVYAMQTVPMARWFGPHAQPPIPILSEPDVGVSMGDKIELGDWKGRTLEEMDAAMAPKGVPDWFRPMMREQAITSYTGERPAWWRDELDDAAEAAHWMGQGYTMEGERAQG